MTNRPRKNSPRSDREGTSDESALRRWSRRKQAAREQGPPAEEAEAAAESTTADASAAPPDAPADPAPPDDAELKTDDDAEAPTDADMPPLESLDSDSDYSQFMSPRVSESLRRMALRKLFGMSTFNVRDGLDDYDEDFTRYKSLGDTVTADMKYHTRRRARLAEEDDTSGAAHDGEPAMEPTAESADKSRADEPAADEHGDAPPPQPHAAHDDEESFDERG